MKLFIAGLLILLAGYAVYGRLVEKVLEPDDRETPAVSRRDGVDFMVLPHWKNMLIQLLNIAGIGPVIGVILGIKFGVIAFVIIPVGNIIGGSVHDFLSGMMSLRSGGANLPEIIRENIGKRFYPYFSAFMIFLLLLVVAVFINVPAQLVDGMVPGHSVFWFAVVVIFAYYIIATLFPVDKIIGLCYPFFGALLLLGTFAVFCGMIVKLVDAPQLLEESAAFKARMFTPAKDQPIIPMLFVTIACGILSGFHATQSPIIARTMSSERQARSSFYGMMVVEGVIAMIWAGAALMIYNLFPELMAKVPGKVLGDITGFFLGKYAGSVTVISVIILAVTSGDTAMRSLRLSLAEMARIPQKKIANRIILCVPLIVIVALLLWWSNKSAATFNQLWNYFAWGNQVLAACTLAAGTIWLGVRGKSGWIAWLPGAFISFVVITYILWTSPAHRGPAGVGLELDYAYLLAGFFVVIITMMLYERIEILRKETRQ
ncbi:MAG: carbon starvation protein A [Lentisphaeria bacterium]|nr:carbon starvation protein A [Lentisphaeria bacterium]